MDVNEIVAEGLIADSSIETPNIPPPPVLVTTTAHETGFPTATSWLAGPLTMVAPPA